MTEKLVIKGGNRLEGSISVNGAKNAAVAVLPAVLLAKGSFVIENLPRIADVFIILKILRTLGAEVEFEENGTARIDTSGVTRYVVDIPLAKKLRASYYFLGSLLGRFGEARVVQPGGCAIGERPIDLHMKGFRALGADAGTMYGMLYAKAEKLTGTEIYIDKISVGTTINLMLASLLAQGNTTLVNAAKEPHVVDVANFLNCMGAKIKGAGTDVIKIRGVESLHGCSYSVIPDQIEAGTFMIAAAATGGRVLVQNVIPTHLDAVSAKLREMGAVVEEMDDSVLVSADGRLKCVNIQTYPYPGFPTDLQQPMTVALSVADGTSVIVENIFESRFKHVNEIRRMGANVQITGKVAIVEGVEKLTGAEVRATDLRAGAAMIIAGLIADGTTVISDIKYIDRGYAGIDERLRGIGADISRVKIEEESEEDYSVGF